MAEYPKYAELPENPIRGKTFELAYAFDDVDSGGSATPVDVSAITFNFYIKDEAGDIVYEDSTDDTMTRPTDATVKVNVSPTATLQFTSGAALRVELEQVSGADKFVVIYSNVVVEN